jgi:4'-phosphopantetheinyl transferase
MTKIYATNIAGGEFSQSRAAHLLLRYALLRDFDCKKAPVLAYGRHGKPFFTDPAHIFFSLSHSGDWAVCAVSDECELGVDIQKIVPAHPRVAQRVFTPEQNEKLRSLPGAERDALFCEYWVLREASIKLAGGSVLERAAPAAPATLVSAPDGYCLAVSFGY